MTHIPARCTLMATWLLLAVLAYAAVPAPPPLPIDPTGEYMSHCYGRPAYRVSIVNEDGVYRTAWGTLGDEPKTHYIGTLKRDGDGWIEVYDKGPHVRGSQTWHWQVVNENPLDFDGDRHWDMRGQKRKMNE